MTNVALASANDADVDEDNDDGGKQQRKQVQQQHSSQTIAITRLAIIRAQITAPASSPHSALSHSSCLQALMSGHSSCRKVTRSASGHSNYSQQPAASFQQQPASSQQPTASSQQAAAAMTAATAMMMMMTVF